MMIRRVVEGDYYVIDEWRKARGLRKLPREYYPTNGMIIEGVAAVFLTKTDTDIALVENIVTNPEATVGDRSKALTKLLKRAEETAKKLGFTMLVGVVSNYDKVSSLAKRRGAALLDATIYGKDLQNGSR